MAENTKDKIKLVYLNTGHYSELHLWKHRLMYLISVKLFVDWGIHKNKSAVTDTAYQLNYIPDKNCIWYKMYKVAKG